ALAAFQVDHGVKPSKMLDAATLAALNVDAAARLAIIDVNLERARWLPRNLPGDRIEVDIAEPQATLYQAGAPVLGMRAIVGDPTRHTPSFASEVTAIVFNPPWVVPASIAAAELYPKERRSPGYLARNGFIVQDGQLIQKAGPKAALGFVKFDMPDPFAVYLHDTPSRWLCHGCVRLEQPRELATALLAAQGWSRAMVEAAIAAKATRRVELETHTPVFVVYRTVVAGSDGRAVFRPDVYGWDAELVAALSGR